MPETNKYFVKPISLTGAELDECLSKGWYRNGQSVFTRHFIIAESKLNTLIWIRLPLSRYQFRKSLRRIINQNNKRFRVEIGPARMEEEKQTLYALYRDQFKGILPDSLMYSLFDFDENNIFNTMETAVYDGEKLVSFSFFDLGENSIASINGVYHPDYARYSLGFYTMLLEIQFGIENDFKFFYPGYVAPGYPRFDYKLRIAHPGQIEYYEIRTRDWQPYLSLNSQKNLVVLIIGNLLQLLQHDSFSHFDTNLVYFPDLDISGLTQDLSRYLETPIFISFNRYNFDEPKFLVTYDIWNKSFVFLHLEKPERITGYILKANNSNEETLILLEHLRSQNVIVQTPDLEVIAKWVVIWDRIMKENFIDGSPVIQ